MAQGVTPLLHRYVFGYNVGVANNGVFIDNTTIGYAAGNVIVFNNLTNNKQRFINRSVSRHNRSHILRNPRGASSVLFLCCIIFCAVSWTLHWRAAHA